MQSFFGEKAVCYYFV